MSNEQAQIMDDLQRIMTKGFGQYDSRFHKESFKCPHYDCKALAHMTWYPCSIRIYTKGEQAEIAGGVKTAEKSFGAHHALFPGLYVSTCHACKNPSIWYDGWLCYPTILSRDVPGPNKAIAGDVLKDYMEAGDILTKSPRGAAALLRLAIQKLVDEIEPGPGTLNAKIGTLKAKGLRDDVVLALDIVRITGNEAVHPGQLDLRDDPQMVESLFILVNRIAEELITSKMELAEMLKKLPPDAVKGIEDRDKKK